MPQTPSIRILETEPNRRGDLFAWLVGDLFHALGYDRVRLNGHKAGREIDVQAGHRSEKRRVVAECKATEKKIGSDAVNKFAGVLDVERRRDPDTPLAGYFVSLASFAETAVEQEEGLDRIVLLDGE